MKRSSWLGVVMPLFCGLLVVGCESIKKPISYEAFDDISYVIDGSNLVVHCRYNERASIDTLVTPFSITDYCINDDGVNRLVSFYGDFSGWNDYETDFQIVIPNSLQSVDGGRVLYDDGASTYPIRKR